MVNRITIKKFMTLFHGWGSVTSCLVEPLQGASLLFTTMFPEIPGTHLILLRRMKGWVNLGATQWFHIQNPWIRNPAPKPLGHCSINHVVFVAWKGVKFQKSYNFPGNTTSRDFCLACLKLNLIVHIKTMWFITFSTKHPICKTSLHLNRC